MLNYNQWGWWLRKWLLINFKGRQKKFDFTVITTLPSTNEWRKYFEKHAKVYDLTTFLDMKDWISFINYIIKVELRKKILYIKEKVLDEIIEEYIREKSESINEDKEKELFNFICEYKKCECIYDVINNSRYYYNVNEANATLSSILDSFPSFQFLSFYFLLFLFH